MFNANRDGSMEIISWLKIRSIEGVFTHTGRRIRSMEPAIGPEKADDNHPSLNNVVALPPFFRAAASF
jgi:hypothetical protein